MAKLTLKKATPEMKSLLRRAGSNEYEIAMAAQREVAKALTMPLKQGVLNGDIIGGIFQPMFFEPGTSVEFPLDFLSPGTEKNFIAVTIPNTGRLPEKHVEGDYLMVSTFDVGAAIDTHLKYLRDARWDVMDRMWQVLEAMFTRKSNDDGWHTILGAAALRGLMVSDDASTPGLFTKRLVALGQIVMRRNAGGNSTSLNRGKLTDLFISPEAHQDVLSWDLTQIPDSVRQQIFSNWENGGLAKIGSVTLHDLDELGVGQDYEDYYENTLGGTLPGTGDEKKVEIAVGLDLSSNDCFVNPQRAEVEAFEDMQLHRQRRAGMYAWGEHGFAILDNRRSLLLSL